MLFHHIFIGGQGLTVTERRKIIMDTLYKQGVIKIIDNASMFEISPETARRDLDFLQRQ